MQGGKVVEEGSAEEVLRRPQHPYTRMLISAVPSFTPRLRPRTADATLVLSTDRLATTYGGAAFFQQARPVRAAADVSSAIPKGATLGLVADSAPSKSTAAPSTAPPHPPHGGPPPLQG